ncbi:MAG TPA: hypothetical protein VL156_17220, partial [Terriglobales bacterium]|nr:hypothetical protein [Terriglobales bacterium]
ARDRGGASGHNGVASAGAKVEGEMCGRGRLAREVGGWHGLREGTDPVTRPAEPSSAILWRKK